MDEREIDSMIESVLFAAGEPVKRERLCVVLGLGLDLVEASATRLMDSYGFERRGIRLLKLGGSYQLVSAPEYAEYVRKILEERRPPPMTRATLETLAIIAYHQPTTRAYIEMVRGVDSTNTVASLAEKGLIEECGRLEVPGRPMQFRTTPVFLRTFGLKSLGELPVLDSPEGELDGQIALNALERLDGGTELDDGEAGTG
ncbi:MAG: SMC-Scp complex subunit ScpB [Oscillospiraceae bacterium]|nr:SMC-Scp complex subunit ScpB [Oscillospiraceae bacterium]